MVIIIYQFRLQSSSKWSHAMADPPSAAESPLGMWQRFSRLILAFGAALELSDAEIANMRLTRLEAELEDLRAQVKK
jgi:hypothetical protein